MNAVKILVLTVLAGMGHLRAAQAIEEALRNLSEKVETKCIDPLKLASPKLSEFLNRFYLWVIKSPLHHFWGFLYENSLLSSSCSPFRWFISKKYAQGIREIVKEFEPDVIVSTHPFATAGAGLLKKKNFIECPLVSCATDFDVHPFGICHEVDIFIVPDITISGYLQKKGISRERIGILGIPITLEFSQKKTKEELREKLGLKQDLPIILLLSGGFGVGPIEEVVVSFKDFGDIAQLVVVAGKDGILKERLEEIRSGIGAQIKVFGYIENMEELMGASDLAITKPGGLSTAEALAKKLPLILLDPIKGQEVKNFKHLVKAGAGVYTKKVEEIPRIVAHLLAHPTRLDLMKSKAEELSRPNSATQIAGLLLSYPRSNFQKFQNLKIPNLW